MSSRGVNKVILVGNLGKDPETRYTPNGDAITNFSVATSEVWKDKQTGQQQEKTEWHRLTAFRKLGEIIGQHAKKGSKVFCEGRLETKKWQHSDGTDRYTTSIIVNDFQFLDSKPSGQHPVQAPAQATNAPVANEPPQYDNDIPF